MSRYIHQLPHWPGFLWNQEALKVPVAAVRHKQRRLLRRMEALRSSVRKEVELEILTIGAMGRESVHYEAPSAGVLDAEMTRFIDWVNQPSGIDPVLKSAIAHLWSVTIHPFDDGNGRVFYDVKESTVEILAIAEKANAQKWLEADRTADAGGRIS